MNLQPIMRRMIEVAGRQGKPVVNNKKIEAAFASAFTKLGLTPMKVRFVANADYAFENPPTERNFILTPLFRNMLFAFPHAVRRFGWRNRFARREPLQRIDREPASAYLDTDLRVFRSVVRSAIRFRNRIKPKGVKKLPRYDVPYYLGFTLTTLLDRLNDYQRRHGELKGDRLAIAEAWLELAKAWNAGAWAFWITPTEIVCVTRPHIHTRNFQLHRLPSEGPAVYWKDGKRTVSRYYFFANAEVRERDWRNEGLTVERILRERNAEIRRALIEMYGLEKFIKDAGAEKMCYDDYGTLWRLRIGRRQATVPLTEEQKTRLREMRRNGASRWRIQRIRARYHRQNNPTVGQRTATTLMWVEVKNSTPEPDGSYRTYFLPCSPRTRTPRQGIAASFGLPEHAYRPKVET